MVLGRIRDLARGGGYGIVLSTHDPDHALLVGTRPVAVIAEGGLAAVGTPQDVVTPRCSRRSIARR